MGNLVGGISSAGRALPDVDGYSFIVGRSKGPFVWDQKGKRYIDTALGFGATILGHGAPSILNAVKAAVESGPMPGFAHNIEEAAAQALAKHCGALSQVIFVNSGSEAVHLACRAARVLTGRRRIAKFAAGYDGWYDDLAFGNAGSPEAAMRANERPATPAMALLRFNDCADTERLFAETNDIAAVLIEPVLANSGCVCPVPGYHEHLQQTARRCGALIIADEVLMGFRLCAGLTSPLFGIEPDMAAVGKIIGSGFAVAALIGTPFAMEGFERGIIARAGTYSGNPIACAAVIATMSELDRLQYDALLSLGDELRSNIQKSFESAGRPFSTTGYGTVFSIWFDSEGPATYDEALAKVRPDLSMRIHQQLRRQGILTMPAQFGRFFLSSAHRREELEQIADAFRLIAAHS